MTAESRSSRLYDILIRQLAHLPLAVATRRLHEEATAAQPGKLFDLPVVVFVQVLGNQPRDLIAVFRQHSFKAWAELLLEEFGLPSSCNSGRAKRRMPGRCETAVVNAVKPRCAWSNRRDIIQLESITR